jgi:hypothetical protein
MSRSAKKNNVDRISGTWRSMSRSAKKQQRVSKYKDVTKHEQRCKVKPSWLEVLEQGDAENARVKSCNGGVKETINYANNSRLLSFVTTRTL